MAAAPETQSVWSPNSSEVRAIDPQSDSGKCEGQGLGECDSWLPYAWQAQRQPFEGTTSGSTLTTTSALWVFRGRSAKAAELCKRVLAIYFVCVP